jgi:hypothetical protein
MSRKDAMSAAVQVMLCMAVSWSLANFPLVRPPVLLRLGVIGGVVQTIDDAAIGALRSCARWNWLHP